MKYLKKLPRMKLIIAEKFFNEIYYSIYLSSTLNFCEEINIDYESLS